MNIYIFSGILLILSGILKILLRWLFPEAFAWESRAKKLFEYFTITIFIILGILNIVKGYVNPAQETIKELEAEVAYEDRV